jgi:Viral BACON domain
MKNPALSALCFVVVFASGLAAQSRSPGILPTEGTVTKVSYLPDPRIESSVVFSGQVAVAPTVCTPNATTYCANNNRFQVQVIFSAPSLGITNAPAQAMFLTGDTGYFWFFSSNNVEIVIKVVDGRTFNGFFWVFYGALSDVAYTITVTDTQTGSIKTYSNSAGSLASVADTAAFPGGTTNCVTSVSTAAPASFGADGGTGVINVLAPAGCTWSATSNSSFISITSASSFNGNGTIFFSVAANASTSSRTGSLTVAGQTVSITQSEAPTEAGPYDGVWSGTTSQTCQLPSGTGPCRVTWTISNNNLLGFEIHYSGSACGINDGATTVTYASPGRTIDPASFNVTSVGTPPVRADFSVDVTKSSTSTATGSGSVSLTLSAPVGNCTTTNPINFTATRDQ